MTEKKIGVIKEQNLQSLFYVDVPKWTSVKLDLFRCLARDLLQRIVANFFGKEVDLHWRYVCSTNSVFVFGATATGLAEQACNWGSPPFPPKFEH